MHKPEYYAERRRGYNVVEVSGIQALTGSNFSVRELEKKGSHREKAVYLLEAEERPKKLRKESIRHHLSMVATSAASLVKEHFDTGAAVVETKDDFNAGGAAEETKDDFGQWKEEVEDEDGGGGGDNDKGIDGSGTSTPPASREQSDQLRRIGAGRRVVEIRVYGKITLSKPYEGETADECFVYKINDKVEDLRQSFGKVRSRNAEQEAVALRTSSERRPTLPVAESA